MKQYLLKVWMTAALTLLALGGVWGQTVTYSPSIGATDVSVSPLLSIEFDGEVTLNPGGSIIVYNSDPSSMVSLSTGSDGSPPLYIPSGPDTRLIINTNVLTIDLSTSSLDFETEYWVYISESALEVDGIAWNQLLASPGEWSFTTKAAPTPLTATLSPADDATNVPVSTSTFEITFSENVKMADGEFFVRLFEKGVTPSKRGVELYSGLISGTIVSIDFDFQFLYGKEYEIVFPANAIKSDATGVLFPGLSAGEWSFTTEAAPFTLDVLLPEDGASNVALDASLVATFNQDIQLGTSDEVHIYAYQSESGVETITTELSVSGSDLIINPTSDLAEGTHYYVVIPAGAVETTSGEPFAGLSDKDAWDFTTVYLPLENPVLSPAHKADGVLKEAVLSLQFDKDIELGSGTIGIYNGSTQEKLFDASSTAVVSIVNNNTLQIDLSNNALAEYETVYDVRIASTLIKRDGSEVYFAGFDAGEWSFTTEAAPFTLDLQEPEDGASNIALDASLVATFNQNIKLGTSAAVHIYDYKSELLVETITTGLSVSGSELTIDPTTDLAEGTHYYVVIPAGAVETTSGEPFAGLSDKDAWDFTTGYLPLENPVLSPAHKDDGVLKDAVFSLQFDKDIELGSGTIGIYNGSTQEKLFNASSTAVVSIVNNNTLQIDLSNNPLLEYETVYDVRIASTLIKRVDSDVYFAGFDAGEWSFTTEVEPDPLLMNTSSPLNSSVEVPRAPTLEVSFNQAIKIGRAS